MALTRLGPTPAHPYWGFEGTPPSIAAQWRLPAHAQIVLNALCSVPYACNTDRWCMNVPALGHRSTRFVLDAHALTRLLCFSHMACT